MIAGPSVNAFTDVPRQARELSTGEIVVNDTCARGRSCCEYPAKPWVNTNALRYATQLIQTHGVMGITRAAGQGRGACVEPSGRGDSGANG